MTSETNSESSQFSTKERLAQKLARLEIINKERPCSECIWHRAKNGYYSCDAAVGSCNYEHSRFTRATKPSDKLRPKSVELKNKSKDNSD